MPNGRLWDVSTLGNPICQNFSAVPIWQAPFMGTAPAFAVTNPVTMLSMNLILVGCAIILGVFVIGRVCWTKKGRSFLVKNRFLVLLLSGLPFLNSVMDLLVIIQLVGRSDWVWVGVVGGLFVLCGIIVGIVAVVQVSHGHNCFVVFVCGLTGMISLNSMWSLTATLRQANHDTEKGQTDIKQKLHDLQYAVRLNFYYFQMPLAFAIAAYGLSYNAFTMGTEQGVFVSAIVVAALNCACMFIGEIGRGNAYTTPENVFWEYQVGVLVYRLSEYTTRLFFVAMLACAYKWYALGLLLLEVVLWTAIGASTESKSQREMQSEKRKVTIKSLRDAKKAVKSKKFASAGGKGAGAAGGVARCDQQFGSALAWGIASVSMLPRELRDKLTDRAVDGSNPYMGAITPLPYYLVRTLEIFIIASLYGNGIGFLPNDHLDPINGTCEDCREHDYAVIIWLVAQCTMVCMVPLILIASPKNSKYATSRCCYQGGGPQSINDIELPTINGVSTSGNFGADPEAAMSPNGYAGSPNSAGMGMGAASPMGRSLGGPGSPMRGGVQSTPQASSPYAFNASPMSSPRGGPQSFRQLSVASLAAQRFAGNRPAYGGVPSPRPRAMLPQPTMNNSPRSRVPSVYSPSRGGGSGPSPLHRI
eukprot:INCI14071.1.p1 GENE.INCI14071.1~~INCI14071.1.p1  ORF type:complete len:644 (+),score=75.13 INCI14071.1:222-2153(+)